MTQTYVLEPSATGIGQEKPYLKHLEQSVTLFCDAALFIL